MLHLHLPEGCLLGWGVLELRLALDPLPTKATRRSPEGRWCWRHDNLIVFLQAQDTAGLHHLGEASNTRPARSFSSSLKATGVWFLKGREGPPPEDNVLPWPWRKGPAEAGFEGHCPRKGATVAQPVLLRCLQGTFKHIYGERERKWGQMLTGALS